MNSTAKNPTLSVLMPNYNHAKFLPEALQAILDQSYRPLEIIIMDDASTDDSVQIIEQFARREPHIRVIRNDQNCGVIQNMNRLLNLASGDYVVGCACDDLVLPGFFEKSINLLAQHPEAGLCSTLSRVINENGDDIGVSHSYIVSTTPTFLKPQRVRSVLRTVGSWMQGNTVIYRRSALIKAGGFIPELHSFTDGFICQVIALMYGACFVPKELAAWRRTENSYGATCRSNIDAEREVLRCARNLMESAYKDLFPPDLAGLYETEMIFGWGRLAHQRLRVQQEHFLTQLESLDANPNPFKAVLYSLIGQSLRAQTLVTLACLTLANFPRLGIRRKLHQYLRMLVAGHSL